MPPEPVTVVVDGDDTILPSRVCPAYGLSRASVTPQFSMVVWLFRGVRDASLDEMPHFAEMPLPEEIP